MVHTHYEQAQITPDIPCSSSRSKDEDLPVEGEVPRYGSAMVSRLRREVYMIWRGAAGGQSVTKSSDVTRSSKYLLT